MVKNHPMEKGDLQIGEFPSNEAYFTVYTAKTIRLTKTYGLFISISGGGSVINWATLSNVDFRQIHKI